MFTTGKDQGPVGMNMQQQGSSASVYESKKQPKGCRDPIFAVLFYVNLGIMLALCIKYGSNPFSEDNNVDENDENDANDAVAKKPSYEGFLYAAAAGGAIAILFSACALLLCMAIPGILIKVAIFFNIAMCVCVAVWGFASGNVIGGVIAIIFLALFCCYAYAVWSRIPFATANLLTGTTAIKSNCGVTLFGYIVVFAAFGWSILWATVMMGVQDSLISCEKDEDGLEVCSTPNYLFIFLLLLSYFFVHQVLKNVVHVTVAGVVGTWWFEPGSKGCCGTSIAGSFIRAVTTSFGSICFGSLIVAFIQALRALVDVAKANDDIGSVLACCLDCLLGCLESLVEYFNKWAFIYVGLYGYGYCEAGKSVMTLFKDRGWDAIIADDLVGMVLGMLSLVVGLITGGISIIFLTATTWFDEYLEFYAGDDTGETNAKIMLFILGLVIGLVMCSILMSSIDSAVLAVIVLFAEGPAEFETNYPELSTQMREAYATAHPGYE